MLTKIINDQLKVTIAEQEIYKPTFFRLTNEQDSAALNELLVKKTYIKVYDTMWAQLKELVKTTNPKLSFTHQQIEDAIQSHLDGVPMEQYGVWVYYPWNEKLVHILDEDEFVFLRTSRNKYKITDDEEDLLAGKKVGVVGMSVGQSVSVTLAMERTVGELRIADFDELEITNLNRLRTGLYNMGLNKTIQVARDIAEIDPYFKVVIFTDGLNEGNMDAFFTDGGKLDLIIDECDGLDIKILLRHKAKSLRVPVLMEASDRGTVDVERFDLEPDRSILHGFIDHLDHTKIGSLTNDEKVPYIMPMLGITTISKRLKASMAEIKETVNTWPQLASAVALGGALCADVTRRILLNKYSESGRYFVDIEELIGDKVPKMEGVYDAEPVTYPEITEQQMLQDADKVALAASAVSAEQMRQMVSAGVFAPSAANNQPWKFLSRDGNLYLFHDKSKSYSWGDQLSFIAQIGLGTAVENICIRATALGLEAEAKIFPLGADNPLVAAISFQKSEFITPDPLEKFIESRCTSRRSGDRSIPPTSDIESLRETIDQTGKAILNISTERAIIEGFADIESAAEKIRFLHPQSHSEFFHSELKWNKSGKEHIPHGLDIKTMELTPSEETGIEVASDPAVIALLNEWGTGNAFEKQINSNIKSSSAVGLVTIPLYDPKAIIEGSRAIERMWLKATELHYSIQPMSAPLFLFYRLLYGDDYKVTEKMRADVNTLFTKLSILFPELYRRHGLFLFRLFKADPPSARSLRKNIDELYINI